MADIISNTNLFRNGMDYKSVLDRFEDQAVFLKTSSKPPISSEQKVALNRRGNILYNQGRIEDARRIFLTTGYSDGLVRIGDFYRSKGRILDALRMYWIAPDKKKSESIIIEISEIIKNMIHEKEDYPK
ncbi:MAG: hypothetical protein LBP81_03720 [Treponema sp.]|jgi:hypothetical protein|nr:hypothetical protein [Treponema sp.]